MQIKIDDLAVRYDQRRVIDGLSLLIEAGSFFTLLGPSGCGKTTLLRAIAGFLPTDAGRLMFGDTDVARLPAHKRNIGMVFQDYALFPDKTVFDNVAYGLRARKVRESDIKTRVAKALERVGLGEFGARLPAALSGGQRQRVALARAMVIEPDVLLMDEPLSNLDAKLRHQVRGTIIELQRESGITTVFVTHDQDEALAMSDRIGVMRAGRLEQVGTPSEIYRTPSTAYVADFIGAANIIDVIVGQPAMPGSTVTVKLDGQPIKCTALHSVPAGAAKLVIRPEDVKLVAAPATSDTPAAHIAHRQYLGSKTAYSITFANGQALSVDCSGDGHDAFAIGDRVVIATNPAKTLVLPA
jgi:iron(III) transport system ATP-binding protein